MLEIFGMRAQRKAEGVMRDAAWRAAIEGRNWPDDSTGMAEPPARIWYDVNSHMTAELDRAAALFGRNGNGSSIAHAVGFWLVRKFGASKASQLADLIVKAVQMESRKAGGGE